MTPPCNCWKRILKFSIWPWLTFFQTNAVCVLCYNRCQELHHTNVIFCYFGQIVEAWYSCVGKLDHRYTPAHWRWMGEHWIHVIRPSVLSVCPPFCRRGSKGLQKSHYDDVIMSAIASQITSLTIVYSTVYPGTDQSKHQSSASLAFVWGIHWRPMNFPDKWPVTRKMFPFDDVIMYWLIPWDGGYWTSVPYFFHYGCLSCYTLIC